MTQNELVEKLTESRYNESKFRALFYCLLMIVISVVLIGFTAPEEVRRKTFNEKDVLNNIYNAQNFEQDTVGTSTGLDTVYFSDGTYNSSVQSHGAEHHVWFLDYDSTYTGGPIIMPDGSGYEQKGWLCVGIVYKTSSGTGTLAHQQKFGRNASL
jgi:hypothetical protein